MSELSPLVRDRDQSAERLFLWGSEFERLFLPPSLRSGLELVVTVPSSTTPSPAMHKLPVSLVGEKDKTTN